MTFDQLTTVRQDGIVQEEIVFRALWQREALERVLFPLKGEKRSAALDEYFDVDSSDVHEKRRRILLGRPRFRFRSSVYLSPPSVENGWEDESTPEETSVDMSSVFDDGNDSDDSLWVASDGDNKKKHMIYRKTFYSGTETILGISYRLQIEAQAMPRYLLQIQDEEKNEQRVEQVDPPPPQKESGLREITKIHYLIYCLNRHEGILENDQVDPEDRVLVPVTNQREKEHGEPGEMEPGYVGQVLIESDLTKGVTIDTTTALEIFGFPKV
ncbi:hypothetical protein BDB01DRAFT_723553 [Pilobolus umbonatus]|nr:hypothetical protein BDB01DRAFT_723553 [Pilobolus umbonatus]